jgi:signal peptidase I
MKSFIKETLLVLAIAAVLTAGLRLTLDRAPVYGACMEPSIAASGENIYINRLAYKFSSPQRGDIVTLHPPNNPDWSATPFIKRIIGLPGETIEVKQGSVYINGKVLNEPYVKNSFTYTMSPILIPAGEYFVMGDNRDIADDSHIFGTVPRKNFIGKAWIVIWPPSDWGLAPNYTFPK